MNLTGRLLLASLLALLGAGSTMAAAAAAQDPYQPVPYVRLKHADWVKSATIYQINTRQFTAEGTFRAAEKELPRLKALNVDILWLMPIHEIGVKNRKGVLGSPYSVKDYLSVNHEFGTMDDFRHFVSAAHAQGMKVIIDWVPNHTAWDNALAAEHPDWYQKNYKGEFRPTAWFDWIDIINLDYSSPGLRKYMTEALKFWVRETDIDGYRCDVAGFVPLDFWNNARKELDAIKPVFMLAEWETRDLHAEAFDMTYAWSWYDGMHRLCSGKEKGLGTMFGYYAWNEGFWPRDAIRMTFVTNHDKNAWEGTGPEQFGDGLQAAIALSVVGDGMPLMYNGQESGETKRLKFFERDPIDWKPVSPLNELYRKLFALKHANSTLWNGHWGALMVCVENSKPDEVLSFVRENAKDKIFAVFNFSAAPAKVTFKDTQLCQGDYVEYLSGEKASIGAGTELGLAPWSFRIYVRPAK
jgi:glycosidase